MPDTPHTSIEPEGRKEELWRCPVHGVLEPRKLSRGWGTGEPGEYGTCPVMLDEDTDCGEVLERPPIALALALALALAQVAATQPVPSYLSEEGVRPKIPDDYWRSVPCGHPPDPVAMYGAAGKPVCHCGVLLYPADTGAFPVPSEAPGPIVPCSSCGCYVAIPPDPASLSASSDTGGAGERQSGKEEEAWVRSIAVALLKRAKTDRPRFLRDLGIECEDGSNEAVGAALRKVCEYGLVAHLGHALGVPDPASPQQSVPDTGEETERGGIAERVDRVLYDLRFLDSEEKLRDWPQHDRLSIFADLEQIKELATQPDPPGEVPECHGCEKWGREELVEVLREVAGLERVRSTKAYRSEALTEAADLLDSLEKRCVEYRAAGGDGDGGEFTSVALPHDPARRVADHLNLSLQRRTVFTSPWTDVEEGTDGC